MTIQDLGSIGEVIAAVATIATLVYLAAQVRQNTRALRSSTFQGISEQMAQNVEPIVVNPGVAVVLQRGMEAPGEVTPEERLRFHSFMVMTFRRMESVYVQSTLGSIEREHVEGFERSILSSLHSAGGSLWWKDAKVNFNASFSAHVDSWLENNTAPEAHSSLGFRLSSGAAHPAAAAGDPQPAPIDHR